MAGADEMRQRVDAFRSAVQRDQDDFESLDVRVIAVKEGDRLISIGGRVLLKDVRASALRKHPDLFEEDITLVQGRLPLSELGRLLDEAVGTGKITIDGKELYLIDRPSGPEVPRSFQAATQVGYQDDRWYYLQNGQHWMANALTWSCEPVDSLIGYQRRRTLERRLGAWGRGYKNLEDLFAAFLPGHPGSRSTDRTQFEFIAPKRIIITPELSGEKIRFHVEVGKRIDRTDLKFTAILLGGGISSRTLLGRQPFEIPLKGWKATQNGYRAQIAIRRSNATSCEVLTVYRGETIVTTYGQLPAEVLPGIANLLLREAGALGQTENVPHPDWAHVVEGMDYPLAILHADLAGHSNLLKRFKDRAKKLFADLEKIFGLVMVSNGAVSKWTGDGGIAFFIGEGKCQRAVRAAFELLLLTEHAHLTKFSDLPRAEFRIGVNAGECEWLKNTDSIHSDAVNLAGHLQKYDAPTSGIAVSGAVLTALNQDLASLFRKAGRKDGIPVYKADLQGLVASSTKS